jgi:hypothetical protein
VGVLREPGHGPHDGSAGRLEEPLHPDGHGLIRVCVAEELVGGRQVDARVHDVRLPGRQVVVLLQQLAGE